MRFPGPIGRPSVPSSEGRDELGFGVGVYAAVGEAGGVAGEAVDAVAVDSVAGGLGEEAGAELGAFWSRPRARVARLKASRSSG